ncbi:SusC/RagA family TonB-linked outer membrane protein [Lunatibacter salilacus]|uniref:SusC/RagA family TonB-linked outer membrane protein n=1 Tax=Lunatibacter salilacus TaxID=2483804 RepID=UPI001F34E6C1|nr:TonB-dependent receptor [Lunatibacter salilacus]
MWGIISLVNFSVAHGFQSNQRVSGVVNDASSNETLPGVNVLIKGTSIGTISDINGDFSLNVPNAESILVFSFIGYLTQEIVVGNQSELNISLVSNAADLEEVVVIGYGTSKKSDLTGSVARVDAETFKNQPMTQLTDMLTGTIAGLSANQSPSAAGGGSLEVRGPTSLSAGTDPMVVLDGVIYNGSIADINPNDIETIDVLKDASSSAVFGARAANGVILVTTKKGSIGKPTINFSAQVGISNTTKDRRPLNAEEYLIFKGDFFREGALNNPNVPQTFYTNPNDLPENVSVNDWLNYNENPNQDPYIEYLSRLNLYPTEQQNALAGRTVDWYDKTMNQGLRQIYDLSIGGGTEDIKYFWSVGYTDTEGIIKGDKHTNIRSRLNVDFKVNDWLSFGANSQFSERDESSVPANLGLMYIASPFGKPFNDDGSVNLRPHDDPSAYHPLMDFYGRDRNRKVNTFFSSIYSNVKLPFGINYRISFQPRYTFTTDQSFWGEQTITGSQTFPGGRGVRQSSKTSEWMLDNLLTWNQQFGVHNFDATFLYNAESFRSWFEQQANQNFAPNANLGYHGLQFGSNPSLNNNDIRQTGDALMGRINYTLLDKYLFTASLRRDGYSAFGQEFPRALFPATAFAWKVSDEGFYDENWLVNRLKFRLSWGLNGNRDIGAYSALAQLGSVLDYDGTNVVVGVQNATLSNPGLTWEKTQSLNFGLDFGLFDDRIDISADYYVGTTEDLLMNRQLPRITGFQSITANLGELENRGFELALRTVNISKVDFLWSSNLVFSLNRNKIKSLFGDEGEYTLLGETRFGELPDFSNHWFPGRAVDIVWDYNVLGVWQMEEADAASVYNLSPGDFKGEDVNEDGVYTDLIDKQFIGYTNPRYNIGFRNEATYKNFTATIFIRASLGHILPFNQALQGSLSHDRRNYDGGPMPYWTPENRNNEFARLRPIHSPYGGGLGIYHPGSFVRIQDLSLSYNMPMATVDRLKLNSMRIFGAVRNLYSFDQWPGWDPESNMTPMPRTYSLGLNLSL